MWLPLVLATAFVLSASAQPKIAVIDVYGERKTPVDRIRKALGVKEGDPLPPSKLDLEERLDKLGDVTAAHVEAVCCDNGAAILYAGIEEKGAPHFELRELEAGEDLKLPSSDDFDALRRAMRKADEASVRADAAALLGNAPVSQALIDDLQFASRDFDPTVRRAAVRGLVIMAAKAKQADPDLKLTVQPTWILEMLNSVVWSDRRAATDALMELTETRNADLLGRVRESGFESLLQMAQWRHLQHALPAYLLFCRVNNIPDEEAQASWSSGGRDKVIARIQREAKKK